LRHRDLRCGRRAWLGGCFFAGQRRGFELELDLAGTAFQRQVAGAPAAALREHHDLRRAGPRTRRPASGTVSLARKVAWAIAATPTPIVVPCHRVIVADGALTGYLGGLERKRLLLDFEAGGGAPRTLHAGDQQQLAVSWTLTGPDGALYQSERPGALGGHRRSKLYGRLDCRSARQALARGGYARHRVYFLEEPTAQAAGYRPCAVCLPAQYAAWKAGH
jgi:hypothetical protein